MGLDQRLSAKAVRMRKATGELMDKAEQDLLSYTEAAEFPSWIIPKIRELGISGLSIKGYGSPGLSTLESGAIAYEFAKRDASIGTFFVVHVGAGMSVIEAFGDEE